MVKKTRNGPLYAVVAAVAVAAVVAGGAIAAGQGPRTSADGPDAGPLPSSGSPTSRPSVPGVPRPTPTPSANPGQTSAPTPKKVEVEVELELDKLPRGRAPQVTYLRGRQVIGGGGESITVPGKQQIVEVGRIGNQVLAVLVRDTATELARFDFSGERPKRIPDVGSLAVSRDGTSVAYAASRTGSGGGRLRGGTVYYEDSSSYREDGTVVPRTLKRPDDWDLRVLAAIDGTVYFRSSADDTAMTWSLYSWRPGTSSATKIESITRPTALSANGSTAASLNSLTDSGSCSAVAAVATGRSSWRTCEYSIIGFTPGGSVAIGAPSSRDGYADGLAAALDGATGNLVTEWTGLSFRDTLAEDDGHLLMLVDDGPDTAAAIIRCTIETGVCELATSPARTDLVFAS